MEIPNTIISQIKAIDYLSLARYGARDYSGTSEPGKLIIEKDVEHYGYVKFKVNGSKFRGNVLIALNGLDTYDVYAYTVRRSKAQGFVVKLKNEVNGVYCDQLVDVLENVVG